MVDKALERTLPAIVADLSSHYKKVAAMLEADSVTNAETLYAAMNKHLDNHDHLYSAAAARGTVPVPTGFEARLAGLDAALSSLRAGLAHY